jgi:branched-subunit amino acid ABC-type transport system permease component
MTILITVVLVSILFWFLNKTKTGKSMKAYSDNEDLALLSGIDPKKNSYDYVDHCRNTCNNWWCFVRT